MVHGKTYILSLSIQAEKREDYLFVQSAFHLLSPQA